jgi:hypothetical protein
VLWAYTQGLTDARSGVVQQEQQSVVAEPGRLGLIRLRDNLFNLIRFEILGHGDMCALAWDRQHALILVSPRQIMLDQMLEEAADRSKPHVPTGYHVGSLGLQM